MKLYVIRAFNSSGGGIGEYHVVASGVNKAKAALRAFDKIIHRVEVIAERVVIIADK
jgi:hypothetical protein